MSRLWPFDDIFDISVPSGGSEFDILITAFLSAIVPFLVLTCAIQVFCWLCCSSSTKKKHQLKDRDGELDPKLVSEGRRWLRQATHDRQSAANDFNSEFPAYEWVCFKCQQSAEKATRAVLIITSTVREHKPTHHDLIEEVKPLKDDHLENLLTDLQNCVGFVSRMRYPDKHPYPLVPHDAYNREQSEVALSIIDTILHYVNERYLEVK